jgi:hypothetical protein
MLGPQHQLRQNHVSNLSRVWNHYSAIYTSFKVHHAAIDSAMHWNLFSTTPELGIVADSPDGPFDVADEATAIESGLRRKNLNRLGVSAGLLIKFDAAIRVALSSFRKKQRINCA